MKRLLMLPGTQCDERLWGPLRASLGHDFELTHWAIAQLELEQVLEQLHQKLINSTPDLVLGFSLGGYLLARYLKEYGDRAVASPIYVLIGNTPTALPEHEVKTRRRIIKNLEISNYQGASKQRVGDLLASSNRSNSELIELIQTMDLDLGPNSLAHQLSFTGVRADCLTALNKLAAKLKIHFITSAKDPLVNYAWLQDLSVLITQHQINGEGHMVPLEYPTQLASLIRKIA